MQSPHVAILHNTDSTNMQNLKHIYWKYKPRKKKKKSRKRTFIKTRTLFNYSFRNFTATRIKSRIKSSYSNLSYLQCNLEGKHYLVVMKMTAMIKFSLLNMTLNLAPCKCNFINMEISSKTVKYKWSKLVGKLTF